MVLTTRGSVAASGGAGEQGCLSVMLSLSLGRGADSVLCAPPPPPQHTPVPDRAGYVFHRVSMDEGLSLESNGRVLFGRGVGIPGFSVCVSGVLGGVRVFVVADSFHAPQGVRTCVLWTPPRLGRLLMRRRDQTPPKRVCPGGCISSPAGHLAGCMELPLPWVCL